MTRTPGNQSPGRTTGRPVILQAGTYRHADGAVPPPGDTQAPPATTEGGADPTTTTGQGLGSTATREGTPTASGSETPTAS